MTDQAQQENLEAQISVIWEQLAALRATGARRMARGTADVTKQAAAAVASVVAPEPARDPEPDTPEVRIERALHRECLSAKQIAKATGLGPLEVEASLKKLRQGRRVSNIGTPEHPVWAWRVGEDASMPELMASVRRMIAFRPMTTREISDLTGVRLSRAEGAMVEIRRGEDPSRILKMSMGRPARWFLISPDVQPAPLRPKGK